MKIEGKMKIDIGIEYLGKNAMFLHQEIGKGEILQDGRKFRLLMTGAGLILQINDNINSWDSYSITWNCLISGLMNILPKLEKLKGDDKLDKGKEKTDKLEK